MDTNRQSLEDYTAEELVTLPYEEICLLRRRAYRAHMDDMDVPDALSAWVTEMERRHGKRGQIWTHRLPWLTLLMVARYGEDPMQWPPEFSEADVKRAERWVSGQDAAPLGFKFIPLDDQE